MGASLTVATILLVAAIGPAAARPGAGFRARPIDEVDREARWRSTGDPDDDIVLASLRLEVGMAARRIHRGAPPHVRRRLLSAGCAGEARTRLDALYTQGSLFFRDAPAHSVRCCTTMRVSAASDFASAVPILFPSRLNAARSPCRERPGDLQRPAERQAGENPDEPHWRLLGSAADQLQYRQHVL